MSELEPIDPKRPVRRNATVFCDRCRQLKPCTRFQAIGGLIEWLCDGATCAPRAHERMREVIANSPPPKDAVNSPALAQWLDIPEPDDLDEYVPEDLRDEAIEHAYSSAESEPIGAERGSGADEPEEDR